MSSTNTSGSLALSLVVELLKTLDLKQTALVFEKESGFKSSNVLDRSSLVNVLDLPESIKTADTSKPLLDGILRLPLQSMPSPVHSTTSTEDTAASSEMATTPGTSPRSNKKEGKLRSRLPSASPSPPQQSSPPSKNGSPTSSTPSVFAVAEAQNRSNSPLLSPSSGEKKSLSERRRNKNLSIAAPSSAMESKEDKRGSSSPNASGRRSPTQLLAPVSLSPTASAAELRQKGGLSALLTVDTKKRRGGGLEPLSASSSPSSISSPSSMFGNPKLGLGLKSSPPKDMKESQGSESQGIPSPAKAQTQMSSSPQTQMLSPQPPEDQKSSQASPLGNIKTSPSASIQSPYVSPGKDKDRSTLSVASLGQSLDESMGSMGSMPKEELSESFDASGSQSYNAADDNADILTFSAKKHKQKVHRVVEVGNKGSTLERGDASVNRTKGSSMRSKKGWDNSNMENSNDNDDFVFAEDTPKSNNDGAGQGQPSGFASQPGSGDSSPMDKQKSFESLNDKDTSKSFESLRSITQDTQDEGDSYGDDFEDADSMESSPRLEKVESLDSVEQMKMHNANDGTDMVDITEESIASEDIDDFEVSVGGMSESFSMLNESTQSMNSQMSGAKSKLLRAAGDGKMNMKKSLSLEDSERSDMLEFSITEQELSQSGSVNFEGMDFTANALPPLQESLKKGKKSGW